MIIAAGVRMEEGKVFCYRAIYRALPSRGAVGLREKKIASCQLQLPAVLFV